MTGIFRRDARKISVSFLLWILLFSFNKVSLAQFTQGNLVVLQIGDGSSALSSAGCPLFLKEYTTSGSVGISVTIPTAGSARLVNSGSATSEGLITRSADFQYILVPGYDAPVGTSTIASTNNPPTPRGIDTVNFNAQVGRAATTTTAFNGNNIRGATSDGNNNYWASGANSGVCYFGAGTPATVSSTVANIRSINIFNNKLYFSTGSGTRGIYVVGAGAPPITSGNTSTLLINTGGSSSSYQFAINSTSDTCYVADDVTGITKYVFNGASWSTAYVLTSTIARGLVVDFSVNPRIVYATTAAANSGNTIIKISDVGASSSSTVIATAPANTVFRGLTFSPYCATPSISSVTSNGPICANQGLNLSVNAIGAYPLYYNWSGNGSFSSTTVQTPTVTNATTGTYSISVINKCSNASSAISVTINPLPLVTANTTSNPICIGNNVTLTGGGASTYTWTGGVNNGVSFSPSSTNTYTVTGTDANGCINSSSVTVTVNPLPIVVANSTSTVICSGQSIVLTGSGASTYTWTGGVSNGVSFNPSSTNTYTVTGTDGNGCINTSSVSVIVNPLPSVTANASSPSVCIGNTVTLTGGGASTYTWTGGVSNGVSFNSSSTNTYTVTGTDANGCINSSSVTVTVNSLPAVVANTTSSVVCSGQSIVLTGSGANTYTWTGGVSNGVSFNPSSTNTYTVTGTDANNCKNTASISVVVNPLPSVTANATPASVCTGGSTTLTGNGASTYTWTGGVSNGVPFNPSSTNSYTVSGTDVNGCINKAVTTVTVNSLPNVIANATSTEICLGSNVTLFGNGATTYTWTGGVSNNVPFSPGTTNTYTVTGTNGAGCTNTDVITVMVDPLPLATTGPNQIICNGQSISVGASPAANCSYSWSPATGLSNAGISNPNAHPVITTMYVLNVTNFVTGCINSSSVTVTVNPLPIVVANSTSTVICSGQSIVLTGSGASTYTWTGGVSNGVSFNPSSTNTYTVTGTDGNGCINTSSVSVIVNPLPSVTANASSPSVCIGNTVTLTGGGASTYTWTGGVSNGVSFNSSSTNTYTVTGTDANGCINSSSVTVTVNSLPAVVANTTSSVVCSGQSIVLTGSGANTYTWTGGVSNGVSFNPSSTNTYTVTGTDANNCKNTASISVVVNPLPSVTANATPASVCTGGSTTLTGNGASTYTWTGGVSNGVPFNPSSTNSYTVSGTDVNGCINKAVTTVTVNSLPNVIANATSTEICLGSNVTLFGNGATTYTWTGGVSNNVPFSPGTTNTYTVTGMDINNCINTATIMVQVDPLPIVTANSTSTVVCNGQQITLTGGGASTFLWSSGVTDGLAFAPGVTNTYTVTGTDTNNCSNTTTISVMVNPLPVISVLGNTPVCIGQSLTLTASGANTYTWVSGPTGSTYIVSPTISTTYTVIGTDINSCTNTVIQNVVVNPLPTVAINGATSVCIGQSILLTGTGANTYTWSGGPNTVSYNISPMANTVYTVTGADINNCVNTATQTVSVNPIPIVNISGTYTTCSGQSITLTASGANTYTWSNGAINSTNTIIPSTSTTYSVTGADMNNCTNTSTQVITVNPLPMVLINQGEVFINITSGTPVILNASGATNYTWISGNPSCATCASITELPNETIQYCISGTDNKGCVKDTCINIIVQELCGEVFIPDAFSPNGDGENDEFKVYGKCISSLTLQVFDRWGNQVFKSNNQAQGWDGTYQGSTMNTGTYIYQAQYTMSSGNNVRTKGNFILMR